MFGYIYLCAVFTILGLALYPSFLEFTLGLVFPKVKIFYSLNGEQFFFDKETYSFVKEKGEFTIINGLESKKILTLFNSLPIKKDGVELIVVEVEPPKLSFGISFVKWVLKKFKII